MSLDRGFGADSMGVHAAAAFQESGRERALLVVEKWSLEQTRWAQRRLGLHPGADVSCQQFDLLNIRPYEVCECPGNLITQLGWADLLTGFLGAQATLFSATVGRIGIGSGTVAATSADTNLGSVATNGGLTGSNWILCGVAPTITTTGSPSTAVFTATFGTAAAVGTWNEWGIDHGTANTGPTATAVGHLVNHAVPAGAGPGTKGAATWTATATLSFT